jgi:hypothetical protein
VGKSSKNISERIRHTRIKQGYCLICGKHGNLTQDHVPPKGSIEITKTEQKHITELLNSAPSSLKGVSSQIGSTFRTICANCNNIHLGNNDKEVARVCHELTEKIRHAFSSPGWHTKSIRVDVDIIKYTRAMIGHILAATSVTECTKPPVQSPYFSPLQEFILGNDSALSSSHDIYYWFYPLRRHLSAKMVLFMNEGNKCCLSLLSFFPIAFLVTEKGKGVFPAHAKKLEPTDTSLTLNLSMHNAKYIEFPFVELTGNSMYLLADFQCVISYPSLGA